MHAQLIWIPGEPGSGPAAIVVRDALTTELHTVTLGTRGELELPDGEGGWYSVPAVRGVILSSDAGFVLVELPGGAVVHTQILWGTQLAKDGKRPQLGVFTRSRRSARRRRLL